MRYCLLFMLTLFALEAFPQRQVSGVITDLDGEILPGVIIRESETDNTVISDMDGKFFITTISNTCSLHVSVFGYMEQTVNITQDTTLHIFLEKEEWELAFGEFGMVPQMGLAKRLSIGANYEAVNSMFGMAFSNGYDELTFLRSTEVFSGVYYESFTKRLFYKMNLQTNFHQDYSFGLNFKWRYPFAPQHFSPFSMLSAGYSQSHYPSKDFVHRDVYVSASTIFDYTALTISTGYQTLNDFCNWGASAGFYTRFKIPVSVGLTTGYYVDYLTYSTFLHGSLHRNIHYRLTYDRIDTFNFFTVGFNFIIYR